jgi:hypothetical protein
MENNKQIGNFLQKSDLILWAGFSGLLVYLYLIIYQPFGTYTFHHPYKFLLLLPYGGIGFLAFALSSWLVERKKEQGLTIATILLETFCIVFLSAIMGYCYNTFWLSKVSPSLENFIYMLGYTLAVVTPIIVFYFLGRFSFQFILKHPLEKLPHEKNPIQKHLLTNIEDSIKNYDNSFGVVQEWTTFLYAEAADNYCYLYHQEDGELRKTIARTTLKNLELEANQDKIVRTHRSFLVNLNHINGYKGNAAGYKIYIGANKIELPVSRSYVPMVLSKLKEK